MTITEANHKNRVQQFPSVLPRLRVRRPTTMEQAEAALKRFRELTSGHIGRTRRVQAFHDVTFTMNSEGLGVHSEELETLRKVQARRGGRWSSRKMTEADSGPVRLQNHYIVSRLSPESVDGGLSRQIPASHVSLPRHPPDKVDNPETDTASD